jgi:hypothetical protein
LFCLFQTRFPHSSTLQVGGKARFASQLENNHFRKARVSRGWLNPALAGLTFEVRTQLAFGFAACLSHVHQTQSSVSNCAGYTLKSECPRQNHRVTTPARDPGTSSTQLRVRCPFVLPAITVSAAESARQVGQPRQLTRRSHRPPLAVDKRSPPTEVALLRSSYWATASGPWTSGSIEVGGLIPAMVWSRTRICPDPYGIACGAPPQAPFRYCGSRSTTAR